MVHLNLHLTVMLKLSRTLLEKSHVMIYGYGKSSLEALKLNNHKNCAFLWYKCFVILRLTPILSRCGCLHIFLFVLCKLPTFEIFVHGYFLSPNIYR